ncbi:hypothetical protein [Bacillus ndiopicus]|uniref:hypothetical protein n=1 Tax=Bacillus ndiopicus TaxID=1347368 RepID=UPI0005A6968E|nr:hypothetical protein [Bacillus ndiopicus]
MKKTVKFPIIISSTVLLTSSLFQIPTIYASTPKPIVSNVEETIQPQAAQVAIFFGGIVVAWIGDGIITYATGRPPAGWIAMGLSSVEQKIKSFDKNNILSRPIQVSSNGQVSGCIAYPCMVSTYGIFDLEETPELNSLERK